MIRTAARLIAIGMALGGAAFAEATVLRTHARAGKKSCPQIWRDPSHPNYDQCRCSKKGLVQDEGACAMKKDANGKTCVYKFEEEEGGTCKTGPNPNPNPENSGEEESQREVTGSTVEGETPQEVEQPGYTGSEDAGETEAEGSTGPNPDESTSPVVSASGMPGCSFVKYWQVTDQDCKSGKNTNTEICAYAASCATATA